MRDWLIRLLGGITAEEAEFLRTQAREIHNIREAILTCARGDFQMQAQLQSGETNARAEPAHFVTGMSTQGLKPIKTLSEPWTARRRRLEREDLRRMSEEKNQKYYEGSRGSNGASEILRD